MVFGRVRHRSLAQGSGPHGSPRTPANDRASHGLATIVAPRVGRVTNAQNPTDAGHRRDLSHEPPRRVRRLRGPQHEERIYPEYRHEMFNELNAEDVLADVTERWRVDGERRRTPGRASPPVQGLPLCLANLTHTTTLISEAPSAYLCDLRNERAAWL